MEKTVSLQSMFTNLPFYERFGRAKQAGFDQVELGGWTELDLSRVRKEIAASGVRLHALTGADSFDLTDPAIREEFHEYLSQSVAVAKGLGCGNLIVQSAGNADAGADPQASPADSADFTGRAAAVQTLMEAAEKAERAGVRLLLKPGTMRPAVAPLHTNSSAGSLVKVIQSPALRLLFTIEPAQWAGGGIEAAFGKYSKQIGYVHIGGEGKEKAGGFWRTKLRPVRDVLQKGLGYKGGIGFDFRPDGGEEACLTEIADVFG